MISMHRFRLPAALVLTLLFAAGAHARDMILTHAKIFTANAHQPYAEAVSVRDGKIVAVGSRQDVNASVGTDAQVVDLDGKTLLPGLIDAHIHAVYGGVDLLSADAKDGIHSLDALAEFAAEAKRAGLGMGGNDVTFGDKGKLDGVLLLAPTMPATLQALRLRVVPPEQP